MGYALITRRGGVGGPNGNVGRHVWLRQQPRYELVEETAEARVLSRHNGTLWRNSDCVYTSSEVEHAGIRKNSGLGGYFLPVYANSADFDKYLGSKYATSASTVKTQLKPKLVGKWVMTSLTGRAYFCTDVRYAPYSAEGGDAVYITYSKVWTIPSVNRYVVENDASAHPPTSTAPDENGFFFEKI